ncbi:hypothetical protein HDU86_000066 [Geranomyces michiganensis]|nr:hypothetical protein HDU86_000066 [Geranomyces michiganensis]
MPTTVRDYLEISSNKSFEQFYSAVRQGKFTPVEIVQILLAPFPHEIPEDRYQQNKLVMDTTAALVWLHYEMFIDEHELANQ